LKAEKEEGIPDPCTMEELKPGGQEDVEESHEDDDTDSTVSTFDQGSPILGALDLELETSKATSLPTDSAIVENPYAGYLKNQKICRLTQVQADVIEKDGMSIRLSLACALSMSRHVVNFRV